MSFVKLDCGLLDSTLWIDRVARELFITALLMAEPHELKVPMKQYNVRDLNETGFVVPEGWYGFVPAAGTGIIRRAGESMDEGLLALERLGSEDPESRSPEFGGRRLVRIDGGFIVLNFVKYRDKDSTTAERSRRWRERQKLKSLNEKQPTRVSDTPSPVIRHQAEAEAEAEAEKKARKAQFQKPNKEQADVYSKEISLPPSEVQSFLDHHDARGWVLSNGKMMVDWKAAMRTWKANGIKFGRIPNASEAKDYSVGTGCFSPNYGKEGVK